eukprot:Clim_evm13s99 gene=Clim_evmTU13s99
MAQNRKPSTQGLEDMGKKTNYLENSVKSAPVDLQDRLLFAIPKKGRLYEKAVALLKDIQISYRRNHRLDIALASNMPVALVFLPAADIALFVAEGRVDLGITGQDMVAEHDADVVELFKLGFGRCKLCVQAPVRSQVSDPKTLLGKRIVTSFRRIAGNYFDNLAAEAGADSGENKTHVMYVSGSVEAACGLGLADAVVDLVETGETMRAAGLEIVSEIMETEACLVMNKHSEHTDLCKNLTKRIAGVIDADRYVALEYNVPRARLSDAIKITPGKKSPTLCPLEDEEWVAVKTLVPKKQANEKMDALEAIGAVDILLFDIHNCRV